LNYILDYGNVSDVVLSANTKSVPIGNTTNMRSTYSAKVAFEKEKAQFSRKQTKKDVMAS